MVVAMKVFWESCLRTIKHNACAEIPKLGGKDASGEEKKAATEKKDGESNSASQANGAQKDPEAPPEVDPEIAKQKEARKLVKKLRQAKELKDKKESGAALLPEQFEKVIKINEIIRQLDALGVDPEGEKKAGDVEAEAGNVTEP